MSNLLAALGRGQLEGLPDKLRRRRRHWEDYSAKLGAVPGLSMMPVAPWGEPNYWLTCITIDPGEYGADRHAVLERAQQYDIEMRPVWKPMHLQPVFAECVSVGGEVAGAIFDRGLCLPSGSSMSDADRARVVEMVLSVREA
jgi:dTDP-4-amino-4,6-dideoxygalactose transaminase